MHEGWSSSKANCHFGENVDTKDQFLGRGDTCLKILLYSRFYHMTRFTTQKFTHHVIYSIQFTVVPNIINYSYIRKHHMLWKIKITTYVLLGTT